MTELPHYTPWEELSALARARIRVKYWVQRWLFDWTSAPRRHGDRGYGWLYLWSGGGYRQHWRLLWWIAVPVRLRHLYVHRFNRLNCRKHGHDDFGWHLRETPPVIDGEETPFSDAAVCSECLTPLSACAGVGSWHDRREVTEGREERV